MKRIKEYRLDALFSKLVRERADYTCERCFRNFREEGKLDCSHLYGRRMRSVRFDPSNAVAHCTTCHRWLTERPVEFAEWIVGHLGEGEADRLRTRAHAPVKRSRGEVKDLFDVMQSELARLESLRLNGRQGRIEFSL